MTKRVVILAVAAALALAGQPALAKGSRGGGGHSGGGHASVGHSGGGHPSGGHAVARGSGSGYAPHGVAQARHPSGGSGYYGGHYSYGHGSYSHGHYGYGYGHYGYGYGSYYPYYGGYYGGYYGSGFGLYLGFGGPYAYGSYGWPYSYAPYGYAPSAEVYASPSSAPDDVDGGGYRGQGDGRASGDYVPNTGRVRLEVRPEDASVYVDDEFWGNASDSRRLTLRAGRHMIELVRPGLPVARREVDVIAGQSIDVLVDLQRP